MDGTALHSIIADGESADVERKATLIQYTALRVLGEAFVVSMVAWPGLLASSSAGAMPHLGPLPRHCPSSAVAGSIPLEGFLFSALHPVLRWGTMADVAGIYQPPYGWGHKVLWVLKPGFYGTVTLRGGSMDRHAALWFAVVENFVDGGPTRAMSLNAGWQKAFSPGESGPSFPGALYIPRAGCYYLQARWKGGQWQGTFAAGR